MTQEKKEWLEKTANIIDRLAKKYCYSQAIIDCETSNVLFADSNRYVGLIYALEEFATYLRGMIKYSELGENIPEKK